jgi:hypothetical protein
VVLAKQHDEEKCGTINVSLTKNLRHRTFDNGNTHSFSPRYQLRGTQGDTEHTEKTEDNGKDFGTRFLEKNFSSGENKRKPRDYVCLSHLFVSPIKVYIGSCLRLDTTAINRKLGAIFQATAEFILPTRQAILSLNTTPQR